MAKTKNKPASTTQGSTTTVTTQPQAENALQHTNILKAPEQFIGPDKLVVNNIVIRNVDRSPKDVGTWRAAHMAAENTYYPNRTRLLDMYKDVELDGHLTGVVEKRIVAAINKNYRFVKNGEDVEEICRLLKSIAFTRMMREWMLSMFWGASGQEFVPGAKFYWKEIPRKHIKPEKQILTVNQTDYEGVPYDPISNVLVQANGRDLGLFLKCAFYVLLKKGDFSDWASYIEIFGQPMMVTRYDTFDEKTKQQLTTMMNEAGNSLRVSIPKQADFEIMDGKTSNGNGDLQDKFKQACNEEISLIVLGVTETANSSSSSGYAQSKTHADQQQEIIKADVQFITGLLNDEKFLNILASYGYDVKGGEFIVEETMPVEDQLNRGKVYQTVQTIGLPLDHDSIYKELNITKPADYKQQIEAAQIEEEEPEEVTNNPDAPPQKQPKKTAMPAQPQKAAAIKLTAWQKFRNSLANFFAHAPQE